MFTLFAPYKTCIFELDERSTDDVAATSGRTVGCRAAIFGSTEFLREVIDADWAHASNLAKNGGTAKEPPVRLDWRAFLVGSCLDESGPIWPEYLGVGLQTIGKDRDEYVRGNIVKRGHESHLSTSPTNTPYLTLTAPPTVGAFS